MAGYIMSLDQGTTSSRCIIFDREGNICSMAQKEFTQHYPKPGWVEHDPNEIWETQLEVAKEAIQQMGIAMEEIKGIGITNQRETTIVWNKKTGKPVYNAIVWQCRRTAEQIMKVKDDGYWEIIKERTGLVPDAYFSASKIAWILEHVEGAREQAMNGELLFGTVDSWLAWKLSGGKLHITDYTNASRTMLFDIRKLEWDMELLEYFQIPATMLPKVVESSQVYGMVATDIFGKEIPIAGIAGDQQAALFGQCCFQKGEVKNTYGTGCFLLMNTADTMIQSQHGLVTTLSAGTKEKEPEYALEGSVFVAGAAVQWLRDEMQVVQSAAQTMECAQQVEDSQGVYMVPAFTGLGAPYWKPYCKGLVLGLTRGCTKNHLIRATLESIAYQTNDIIEAMKEDVNEPFTSLRVDGGASSNDFLMQFQADICDSYVERPACVETTALGAAYLAGLATGYWSSLDDIKQNCRIEKRFEPKMEQKVRNCLKQGWKHAVNIAILASETEGI